MRCPKCRSTSHFCRETKRATIVEPEDAYRRRRVCRECGYEWITTERQDRWDPQLKQWVGYQVPELPPVPPPAKARRGRDSAAAFFPVTMEDATELLLGIPSEVAISFLEWWNYSRRSKHSTHAAWTRGAFRMSAERLKKLALWQQVLLVQAGVEHGWQALNPAYVRDEFTKGPPRQPGAGFIPQSSGLAGALAIIEGEGHGG